MDELDFKSKILYHYRNIQFNSMLLTCKEAINTFKNDNTSFKLYHSLALILINRIEEALHDLEAIKEEAEVKLAAFLGFVHCHRVLGLANKEMLVRFDSRIKELRRSADVKDMYNSSIVALIVLNKIDKSIDFIEKALVLQPNNAEFLTLRGMLLLNFKKSVKDIPQIKSELFQNALVSNSKNLSTILGYTECWLYLQEYSEALNTINKAVVRYPATLLPLMGKMKTHFCMKDFDQSTETILRILDVQSNNLDALKYRAIISLLLNYSDQLDNLEEYFKQVMACEPNNINILLNSSKLFSRICNKRQDVIKITMRVLLENALAINAEHTDVIIELGYQALLCDKIRDSQKYFKSVTKIDPSSFDALLGLSLCELYENGVSAQLKKQVEFLLEHSQDNKVFQYLLAKTADNSEAALNYLNALSETIKTDMKSDIYSDEYLEVVDPNFVISIVKEILLHNKNNVHILSLLNLLIQSYPMHTDALKLLAEYQHINNDSFGALKTLDKLNNTFDIEALLLKAKILVENKDFSQALQTLESCVAGDFKVRDNYLYYYINGLIEKNTGTSNIHDAIKSFNTALNIIKNHQTNVKLSEKAAIFIELIDTLNLIGQQDDAGKILEDATEQLKDTVEETRLILLSADSCVARKNVQGAIDLLNKIQKSDDGYYRQAQMKIADILLKYRRDTYAYLDVFQRFVEEAPDVESYVMLGDAFMRVLEPEEALNCYETALQQKPDDVYLTSKMGKALVETHFFTRAVDYYKMAIKNIHNALSLKLDLAELYYNLKEYDKGELLLLNELENSTGQSDNDLTYIRDKTKLLRLLARIQEESGNLTYAGKSLKDALENQNRVRKRLLVEQNAVPDAELNELVEISMKLADMALLQKRFDDAIVFYKEGLEVSPNNVAILVAMAKCYMQMGLLDSCQQICNSIFRTDPENEQASIMMADIAFRKVDFDMAQFHFIQILNKQPTNWEALVRLIEVSRRNGNIEICGDFIKAAEKLCNIPSKEAGFQYCNGLYQWYTSNLNGALRSFNQTRSDTVFGKKSIVNMIEICLNPDEEMLTDQIIDNSDDDEYRGSRSMALKTADKLLVDLRQKCGSHNEDLLKVRLLSSFTLIATKEKHNVERALENFITIGSQNDTKDNLGAILGMSTAYIFLKQSQRAKNQLKRVIKNVWNYEDAEYLERCWLLLADLYLQATKYDVASDLLNKILTNNKACIKAYECLGYVAEKEQRFKDGVSFYQMAWKFGGKTNPTVGYKFAYCLMKCKKYPYAIDIAQEVLKLNPDYPRVKKDVLDKCMNNLRV